MSMIELLDVSQHEDESPDFEKRYDAIVLGVEVVIRHILVIWKARQPS